MTFSLCDWVQGCFLSSASSRLRIAASGRLTSSRGRTLATAWMILARLTMPTSSPFSFTTGTRLMWFFSNSSAISCSGVSGAAVLTFRVMMSFTLVAWDLT